MPTWPSELPGLTVGTSVNIGDGALRDPGDKGPPIARQRFTAVTDPFTVPFRLSGTQMSVLRSFYKEDLGNGALSFSYQSPITLLSANIRFVKPPTGFRSVVSGPTLERRRYVGSVELEVIP